MRAWEIDVNRKLQKHLFARVMKSTCNLTFVVVVVVVYFILSRLLYLALSANLGLLCMLHPGMGPLTSLPKDG